MSASLPNAGAPVPIVIYRERLLPASETFVLAQGESMTRYRPTYVGTHLANGLTPPDDRTLLLVTGALASARRHALAFSGRSREAVRRLAEIQPALLHAHFGLDGLRLLPLARKLQRPLVVTFHGWDALTSTQQLLRGSPGHRQLGLGRSRLLQDASLVLAVSDYVREALLRLGADPAKTVRHYVGVDTSFWRPAVRSGHDSYLLFVGRLVDVKGVEHLLRAMASVGAKFPSTGLVVVGDGPLRPRLQRLAQELRTPTEFRGELPPDRVRDLVQAATAVVSPSIQLPNGTVEALNLVSLEAQACGIPVIVTRSGGLPETVDDERTGYIVRACDSAALAEAIIGLLSDRERRIRIGAAARARVTRDFDLRAQSGLLEDLYDQVLHQRPAG